MKFCILVGFLSATLTVYGETNTAATSLKGQPLRDRGFAQVPAGQSSKEGGTADLGAFKDIGQNVGRADNRVHSNAPQICSRVCDYPPMDLDGHILPYYELRGTRVRNAMLSLTSARIARSEKGVSHFFPQVGGFLKPYIGDQGLGDLSYNSRYELAEKMWALNPRLAKKARRAREKERRRNERLNLPLPACADGTCTDCAFPSNPITPKPVCSSAPVKKARYNLALFSRNVKYLESVLGRDRVKKLIHSDMHNLLNAPGSGYYESSPIFSTINAYLGKREGKKWIQKVVDSGGLSALNRYSSNIKRVDALLDKFEDRYGRDLTLKVLKEEPELFLKENLNPLIKTFHVLDPKKPLFKAPVAPTCYDECSGAEAPPAEVRWDNDNVIEEVSVPMVPAPKRGSAAQ